MTGWNLPPGCNVSDIPGNGPDDAKAEALADAIYDVLDTTSVEGREFDEWKTKVVEEILKICDLVYADGYRQGQSDEAMAQQYQQEKND